VRGALNAYRDFPHTFPEALAIPEAVGVAKNYNFYEFSYLINFAKTSPNLREFYGELIEICFAANFSIYFQMDIKYGTSPANEDANHVISIEQQPIAEEEIEFLEIQKQEQQNLVDAVAAATIEKGPGPGAAAISTPGQDEIMELARLKKERRKQQQKDYLKKKIEKMTEEEQKQF
jgi:hypothetical protein